jgi:hypothetical protein
LLGCLDSVRTIDQKLGTIEVEVPIPEIGLAPALHKLLRIAAQTGRAGARQDRTAASMRDTERMEDHERFSTQQARAIGERIGIDWSSSRFDVEQFRVGLGVELEHGRRDPATNVTDDDEQTTGKIAWAHLNEYTDYYTRLAQMEAEAERYWSDRD